MVLIMSCRNYKAQKSRFRFRPLAGIMVLIITSTSCLKKRRPFVSVPLRGLWFLSCPVVRRNAERTRHVSVPLRGLWFLSMTREQAIRNYVEQFPSPCGDYGSYPMLQSCVNYSDRLVSVPLRGLWFLSFKVMWKKWLVEIGKFPSPCGDYGSYLNKRKRRDDVLYRFRPLAGIMVLILINSIQLFFQGSFPSPCGDYGSYLLNIPATFGIPDDLVSVPLRGLWFLSRATISCIL